MRGQHFEKKTFPEATRKIMSPWLAEILSDNIFTNSAPLGRVGHRVAMSVCLSVCLSSSSFLFLFRKKL